MANVIVDTPEALPGEGLTGIGDTLLVTSQGSIVDDTQPSAGIGTAVSGTGADETITLDGSVYCAYNASGTDAGIGVYLTASSDALTVNSLVQGATGAVQDTGTDGIINVGAIGFLQGIGSSAYGLEIEGTGTATNDTLTNQGWITGTVGVLVKGGGSDTILNSGNISGGIGIGYNSGTLRRKTSRTRERSRRRATRLRV